MRKIILFPLFFMIACLSTIHAQTTTSSNNNPDALVVQLGLDATYYYGQPDRNFSKFENERLNWQISGIVGYTLARSKSGKRTMVAAFGNYGFNNNNTVSFLLKDQDYTTAALSQSSANNYYRLEGGLIIAEIIRISTGIGQQNFDNQTLTSSSGVKPDAKLLKFNSSTVGLQFYFGKIGWLINCQFAYGMDFNNTVITPSSGLTFRF
ncbi:MAG: hypothetical protein ABI861_03270 [Panacibacter sp.]